MHQIRPDRKTFMTTKNFIPYLSRAPGRGHIETWVKIAAGAATLVAFWFYRESLVELITIARDREAVVAYLQTYGILGPILLSACIMLQVVISTIPGHVFIIVGGYLYGFAGGFLLTCISQFIAGQLAFIMTRKAGRPVVDRLVKGTSIDIWKKRANHQGILFYLLAFNIPVFPSDTMCYVAGLSDISPRKFAIANLFGRMPGIILMTLVGSHGLHLSPAVLVILAAGSLPLVILWSLYRDRIKRQFNREVRGSGAGCGIRPTERQKEDTTASGIRPPPTVRSAHPSAPPPFHPF
jgi:uncharacterized membrane protein YdjX (TVP38/TMEM64 family)